METEYRNDFTEFLDKYRVDNIMKQEDWFKQCMSTYLWYQDIIDDDWDENNQKHIAFRLPGATRGHITVDKNYKILDILFYKETCFGHKVNEVNCYKEDVVIEATKKFRDTILDIHNGYVGDDYLHEK